MDTVVADDLLPGIVYSIHGAREFQADAVCLFRKNRLASACVLATIALEHLGQANWLVKRFLQAKQGKILSWEQVRRGMSRGREAKLKDAVFALTFEMPSNVDVSANPEAAWCLVKKITNRAPDKFHKLRTTAQYVNAGDTGKNWTTLLKLGEKDVHDLLLNAGNCYRTYLLTGLLKVKPIEEEIERMQRREKLFDPTDIWPPPEGKHFSWAHLHGREYRASGPGQRHPHRRGPRPGTQPPLSEDESPGHHGPGLASREKRDGREVKQKCFSSSIT